MKSNSSHVIFFLFSLLLLTNCASTQQEENSTKLVLTSIAPIFQITQALLADTNISVENIPSRPRSLLAQSTFLSRQGERFSEQFINADAVITIGKLWPQDALYTTAREANIHIINIDASKPWSHERAGVTISNSPTTGEISPYFWLSPANAIRMLNIVAYDLQILYPDQAPLIAANLVNEKNNIVQMKAAFETKFIEVPDPFVYALTDELTYLTSELGIFVDDYFVKQDIDWTTEDLMQLTEHLLRAEIKVVLHKWQPSEEITAAIHAANAELVVLDLMETSSENYNLLMANNLNALLEALLPR